MTRDSSNHASDSAVRALSLALLLGVAALVLVLAPRSSTQAPTPKTPVKDRTINAGSLHVQAGANFGRSFGTGPFGIVGDAVDDVVICATAEQVPTPAVPSGVRNVGAAYPFQDVGLDPLLLADQILPPSGQIEEDLGFGVLDVEIGNVRGPNSNNLVFVAAAHAGIALGTDGIGAVDVYDMTGALSPFGDPTQVVLELVPPLDPDTCPGQGTPAARFGHSFAIADVDGDGTNDLIVGGVMPHLWPFVTSVAINPDQKEATVELGALSLPLDLKVALEARVADKTGATAWDWQITPPGDL